MHTLTSRVVPHLPLPTAIAAAASLGHALQVRNGFYAPEALAWLTIAIILSLASGITWRWRQPLTPGMRGAVQVLFIAVLGWQLFDLARWWPAMYMDHTGGRAWYRAGLVVEVFLVLASLIRGHWIRRVWFPALVAIHTLLGVWVLHRSPAPRVDVVLVHDAAVEALRAARSPYDVTFANLYGDDTTYYPHDRITGDMVRWGYPYPPLSLLIVAPFKILFGDFRYGLIAALVVAVVTVGYMTPDPISRLSAALLLTQPRGFFVLEQGWTEPIAVALLALLAAAMMRAPRAVGILAGLFVTAKQYLVVPGLLCLRFILAQPGRVRLCVSAVAAGTIVIIPFLIADPHGFVQFVVFQQAQEPFRADALSYLSWASRHGWGHGSMLWAAGAALATTIGCWRLLPNTPGGVMLGTSLTMLLTFAFGSKAFCNYYYFVVGALCIAMALGPLDAAQGSSTIKARGH